jgi:precorrin-2 dehydrogenase/sirohydrochlorin ferrochelatase
MQFPINLNLEGRACLLIGGGPIATRKARQILACGAALTVIAPEITDELRSLPVSIEQRTYRSGDLEGFRLVITATANPVVDQQIFDEAERLGIWVNSADDPARCTFTLPAVIRRDNVMVTASTGGVSPALSTWLRQHLGEIITEEFARISAELAAERARIHAEGASTEDTDWRPIIDAIAARHGIAGFAIRSEVSAS